MGEKKFGKLEGLAIVSNDTVRERASGEKTPAGMYPGSDAILFKTVDGKYSYRRIGPEQSLALRRVLNGEPSIDYMNLQQILKYTGNRIKAASIEAGGVQLELYDGTKFNVDGSFGLPFALFNHADIDVEECKLEEPLPSIAQELEEKGGFHRVPLESGMETLPLLIDDSEYETVQCVGAETGIGHGSGATKYSEKVRYSRVLGVSLELEMPDGSTHIVGHTSDSIDSIAEIRDDLLRAGYALTDELTSGDTKIKTRFVDGPESAVRRGRVTRVQLYNELKGEHYDVELSIKPETYGNRDADVMERMVSAKQKGREMHILECFHEIGPNTTEPTNIEAWLMLNSGAKIKTIYLDIG